MVSESFLAGKRLNEQGGVREMNTIGIDVSKEKLDCAWLREQDKLKTKVFANKSTGWQELLDWATKNTGLAMEHLHFVMEATGIYHEQLALTKARGCRS
jgi:transposase